MARCIVCGKKGLFLKISIHGLCNECEAKYQKEEEQRQILEEKKKWIPPVIERYGKTFYRRNKYYTDCKAKPSIAYAGCFQENMPIKFEIEYDKELSENFVKIRTLDEKHVGTVLSYGVVCMLIDLEEENKVFRGSIKNITDGYITFTIWMYSDKLGSLESLPPCQLESTQEEYEEYLKIVKPKNQVVEIVDNKVLFSGKPIGSISEKSVKDILDLKKDYYVICALFGTRKAKEHPAITIKAYYIPLELPEEIMVKDNADMPSLEE